MPKVNASEKTFGQVKKELAEFKAKYEENKHQQQLTKEEQEKIMVKRYGKPEEVAYLVKFLISDEANFINNSIIRIDGGQIGSM